VIASGESVIANPEIRDEITANNRKIAAIAMEGYGVSAAAWKQDKPVRCLVIRANCNPL
jgi:nucleoside phosphorylase